MSKLIYLDPGHGGKDSGAVGYGRNEADDVLKMAKKVKSLLSAYNCKVGMTRTNDTYTSPKGKAEIANKAGADFFASFHRNSSDSSSSKGYESLVYANSGTKKEFANKINAKMKAVGFTNRGTKVRTDLAVLHQTNMPAVLLELGFISNKKDNEIFVSKFDKIAEAITAVIVDVNNLKKVTTTSNASIKAGSTVKIKSGAKYGGASSGKSVSSAYIGKKYTVTKVQTNNGVKEALIKQLNSWVPTKYLSIV
ncbi:MAG: N-acetylmuramoyl-L-alanine amidase [Anaerostipes sp.]|nr:N-acetylmuramoyl-L-alanine amidase [Anaerostipes sp.]